LQLKGIAMLIKGRKYYINRYIEEYLIYVIDGIVISTKSNIVFSKKKREIFNIIKTGGPLTFVDFGNIYDGSKVYPIFIVGDEKVIMFYKEKDFSLYKEVIQEEMDI